MTVKEFCEKVSSNIDNMDVELYNIDNMDVELYEVNEDTTLCTTIGEMSSDDGLHEEWKNAEIEGWFTDDEGYLILSVIT